MSLNLVVLDLPFNFEVLGFAFSPVRTFLYLLYSPAWKALDLV